MKTIDKIIVDRALAANKELSTELRNAAFIPVFGNDVSCLKDQAFIDCKNIILKSLPEQISAVDSGAFQNCTGITHFSLPNISCIGSNVFKGCTNLSTFEFTENNISIGADAFDQTALSTVKLSPNMSVLGEYAFTNCSNLVSAYGNSILSTSNCSFYQCPNLSAVDFQNLKFLARHSFFQVGFKELKLNSVQQIETEAIGVAKMLEIASFPNCLSGLAMGEALFYGWWYDESFPVLHKINLPKMTFCNCGIAYELNELVNVDLQSLEQFDGSYYLFYDCSKISSISLPKLSCLNGIIAENCDGLKTIDLPNLSTVNEYEYFNIFAANCRSLSGIAIPKMQTPLDQQQSFIGCENLVSVYIDNNIQKSVNNGAIIVNANDYNDIKYVCPAAKILSGDWLVDLKPLENYIDQFYEIYCPKVLNLSIEQFMYANNLQVVEFNGVSNIPIETFYECKNLKSASFNSALSIDSYAIDTCGSLSSINVPSVKQFMDGAFWDCENLLSIVMSALTAVPCIVDGDGNIDESLEPWYGINRDYKVYVNADIRDTMANTGWWKNIADKIIAL